MRKSLLSVLTLASALAAMPASAADFTQSTTNVIPNSGTGATTGSPAFIYPITFNVSGVGIVSKVTFTLTDLSHTFPDDLDILLVGPTGVTVVLISDVGDTNDLDHATYTFDDDATNIFSDAGANPSGTYKPANYGTLDDLYPAPAPAGPYGTTLSLFNGTKATACGLCTLSTTPPPTSARSRVPRYRSTPPARSLSPPVGP